MFMSVAPRTDCYSRGEASKFDSVVKKLPSNLGDAQELPNEAEMLPEDAKITPQGPHNYRSQQKYVAMWQ